VQKRLYFDQDAVWDAEVGGSREPCIRQGSSLAPPDEYDSTVYVRRRIDAALCQITLTTFCVNGDSMSAWRCGKRMELHHGGYVFVIVCLFVCL